MEYTPRLSSARRRAKRAQRVGAPGGRRHRRDAALLYDVVATAELDAARTPPSTDNDDDARAPDGSALALMAKHSLRASQVRHRTTDAHMKIKKRQYTAVRHAFCRYLKVTPSTIMPSFIAVQ